MKIRKYTPSIIIHKLKTFQPSSTKLELTMDSKLSTRLTANEKRKIKLLASIFSGLYSTVKIFVLAVNSRIIYCLFLCDLFNGYKKRTQN